MISQEQSSGAVEQWSSDFSWLFVFAMDALSTVSLDQSGKWVLCKLCFCHKLVLENKDVEVNIVFVFYCNLRHWLFLSIFTHDSM